MRTTVTIVPARPDIFNIANIPAPGGRARVFNVTNRIHTGEPFNVTTRRIRPFGRTPTVLRVYLTGVATSIRSNTTIRIGTRTTTGTVVTGDATLFDTGIYYIDFTLPPDMEGVGDQPIIVTVTIEGVTFSSRFDDTASFINIL